MPKQRLTYNYIFESFKKCGYLLITKDYINSRQKLEYICNNNHKHSITWDNWKQGTRCPYCAGQGKLSIDYIKEVMLNEGYLLLTENYINSSEKLKCICSSGHECKISWSNWKSGRRCATCKKIRLSKLNSRSNHPNWKGGITELNKEIRNLIKKNGWYLEVFKRDKYTCVICSKSNIYLEAHHIISLQFLKKYFNIKNISDAKNCKLLFDINNGITLCKECHKTIHKKLKEIVNEQ